MTSGAIIVSQIETVEHKSIKAVASVRIGAVLIHGIRVIQKSDGFQWVALPKEKRGEEYHPVIEVKSRELMRGISEAVLCAYNNETSPEHTLTLLGAKEKKQNRSRPLKASFREEKGQQRMPDDEIPWIL